MIPAYNGYIMPPAPITEANLVSGPPDAESQVWDPDAAADYVLGDQVWWTGHVWRRNADPVDVPGTGGWDDEGQVDRGASAHVDGQSYNTSEWAVKNHRLYQSAADNNTTTPPSSPKWTNFGPTNRHRIFDLYLNRLSLGLTKIEWKIVIPQVVTFGMLMIPRGGRARLVSKRPDGTVVYDQTFRLTRDSGGGAYRYRWSPIQQAAAVIMPDLGAYAGNELTVTIEGAPGATVGGGQLVFGWAETIGIVVPGSAVGFEAFSDVKFDQWGNPSVTTGVKQRTATFALKGDILHNERVYNAIAEQANKPTAIFMRNGEAYGLAGYGFLENFYVSMPNTVVSQTTVNLRGLAE